MIHLVLIKRQQNSRIISEVWSWLGRMLRHQPHICRFPIQFSINAKWCVITCLLLQHLKSCPGSLDGSSWCSWEHQAHHKEQNQQPPQCLGCVLIDIQEHPKQTCQTIQTCNNNSRSARNSWWTCWYGILWQPKALPNTIGKPLFLWLPKGPRVQLGKWMLSACLFLMFILNHLWLTFAQDTVQSQGHFAWLQQMLWLKLWDESL